MKGVMLPPAHIRWLYIWAECRWKTPQNCNQSKIILISQKWLSQYQGGILALSHSLYNTHLQQFHGIACAFCSTWLLHSLKKSCDSVGNSLLNSSQLFTHPLSLLLLSVCPPMETVSSPARSHSSTMQFRRSSLHLRKMCINIKQFL